MPAVMEAPASSGNVDTNARVIRNVKVLGIHSRNTGRVLGLSERDYGRAIDEPYSYTMEALRQAAKLYENVNVYSNHRKFDYDQNGHRIVIQDSRDNEELIGWLKNVRVVEGQGIFADLHYTAHPFTETLIDLATRAPNKLALSHEAYFGQAKLINGKIHLTQISGVDSVALVSSDPATTNGLFESVPLSASDSLVVERRKPKPKPKAKPKPIVKAKPKAKLKAATKPKPQPVTVEQTRPAIDYDDPRQFAAAIRGVPIDRLVTEQRAAPPKPTGYDDPAVFAAAIRGSAVVEQRASQPKPKPAPAKQKSFAERALEVLSGPSTTISEAVDELVSYPHYP